MANPWITHVKNYAIKNKMTYAAALSDPKCKASYKGGSKMSNESMAPTISFS